MAKRKVSPVVKIFTVFIIGLILWNVFFTGDSPDVTQNNRPPVQTSQNNANVNTGNQDTTQETLNSLSAQQNEFTSQYQAERDAMNLKITSLTTQNEELLQQLQRDGQAQTNAMTSQLSELQNQLNALADDVNTNPLLNSPGQTGDPALENLTISSSLTAASAASLQRDNDGYVIIEPETVRASMQVPGDASSGNGILSGFDGLGSALSGSADGSDRGGSVTGSTRGVLNTAGVIGQQLGGNEQQGRNGQGTSGGVPMLTIPENTRFFNVVAKSTILGRLPRGGTVQEPYEFQLELSAENVTPGGYRVPGLDKMVMRGVATGDGALKCARGRVFSLTFVFDDGRIAQIGGQDSSSQNRPLATILDAYGTECVPGKEVGNEGTYAAAQIGAQSIQSLANARAQTQLESIDTGSGVTTNVTGSSGEYIAAELLSGTGGAISDFVRNKYADVFNAIMVPLGTELVVEFKQQIDINYDQAGRLIVHPGWRSQQAKRTGFFQ